MFVFHRVVYKAFSRFLTKRHFLRLGCLKLAQQQQINNKRLVLLQRGAVEKKMLNAVQGQVLNSSCNIEKSSKHNEEKSQTILDEEAMLYYHVM